MDEMKKLYAKVAKSPMLQRKIIWIANEAPEAGYKKTKERLLDFAADAGFDVTIEEIKTFFQELAEREKAKADEKQQIELTETELDMVAGGKAAETALTALFSKYL